MSQDQLDARRQEILAAARACFARHGYEGATVRRLEEATGLSRGAIFHHFRDKDSLFLAVAEDDAAAMVETVARNGLVQVMRDLLARAALRRHGRLARQPARGVPAAAHRPGVREALGRALRGDRRRHPRAAAAASATPACCATTCRSTCSPSSWSWRTTGWSCTWRWAARRATSSRVLDLVEEAVRRRLSTSACALPAQ